MEWIAPPACPRCGAGRSGERCGECEGRDFRFAGAAALGKYDGRLRDFLLILKFRGGRHLADEFGRRLATKVDLVVPVPMSRWKLHFRGYNAAALVAERLARHAGLTYLGSALRKIRRTRLQAELEREGRLQNPKGAYRASGGRGASSSWWTTC